MNSTEGSPFAKDSLPFNAVAWSSVAIGGLALLSLAITGILFPGTLMLIEPLFPLIEIAIVGIVSYSGARFIKSCLANKCKNKPLALIETIEPIFYLELNRLWIMPAVLGAWSASGFLSKNLLNRLLAGAKEALMQNGQAISGFMESLLKFSRTGYVEAFASLSAIGAAVSIHYLLKWNLLLAAEIGKINDEINKIIGAESATD